MTGLPSRSHAWKPCPDPTPPVPIIPDTWSVANLNWVAVIGTTLGHFEDSSSNPWYLSAVGDSTVGTVTWKIDTTAPSGGNVEALFTSTTANVLKNGVVDRGAGTITYNLHTYKVPQYWNTTSGVMTAILE